MSEALQIEYIDVGELIPYDNNARTHSPEQIDEIIQSIKTYGYVNPISINSQNIIVCGHGRLEAAKKLGLAKLPCIKHTQFDAETLRKGYTIADNKLALKADWDYERLKEDFELLEAEAFAATNTGFSQEEIDAILNPEVEVDPEESDEVPELPAEPITKLGDTWILGRHRLVCGDSTNIQDVEKLINGQTIDMVYTDPPYGINIANNPVRQKHEKKDWDKTAPTKDFFEYMLTLAPGCIIWGGNYFELPPSQGYFIWDKKQPEDFSLAMCEMAWSSRKMPAKIYRESVTSYKKEHPTQKPIGLCLWVFKFFEGAVTVVDLFGGSGSTLIACEKSKRNCYMMELSPNYVDVIIKRWQNESKQDAILESNGQTYNSLLT